MTPAKTSMNRTLLNITRCQSCDRVCWIVSRHSTKTCWNKSTLTPNTRSVVWWLLGEDTAGRVGWLWWAWHLAAVGKGLLGSIKEGNWIPVQMTGPADRLSWHVLETGCIVGAVNCKAFSQQYWEPGITGGEMEVETLRETQEGAGTHGVSAMKASRGGCCVAKCPLVLYLRHTAVP